jgi:DNA-binding response OmpR family regulator
MTDNERNDRVLVVDDESAYTDLLAAWLKDDYEVLTATSGPAALDEFRSVGGDVDVVLLDRRMPGISGDETLEQIRDTNYECQVAMVTAVEPSFDVVDMGFDDYLVKPISREELKEVVANLLDRANYQKGVQELFALASKVAVLEERHPTAELESSEKYAQLRERLDGKFEELDDLLTDLSDEEYATIFRKFDA